MFSLSQMGMRQCLPVVALCCLMPTAMAVPPVAYTAKTEAVKRVIKAAYNAQSKALLAHNLDGVMAPYAKNILFVDDLRHTKHRGTDQARSGWAGFFQRTQQTLTGANSEIKTITVSPAGTDATVVSVRHLTMQGVFHKDTPYVMGIASTLRCVWAKTDMGWRVTQERFLAVDTFLNGKLVSHNHKHVPS